LKKFFPFVLRTSQVILVNNYPQKKVELSTSQKKLKFISSLSWNDHLFNIFKIIKSQSSCLFLNFFWSVLRLPFFIQKNSLFRGQVNSSSIAFYQ
jgi:hypothetical protein